MTIGKRTGGTALFALLAGVAIAQQAGQPAPKLTISEARGIKKEATIADFKGKWVVIDFWGHW